MSSRDADPTATGAEDPTASAGHASPSAPAADPTATAYSGSDGPPFPVGLVQDAAYTPIEEAWRRMEEKLAHGLVAQLEEGRESHREVMARIGLESDPPEESAAEEDGLLEYRRTVSTALLTPLIATLETRGPSTRIAERTKEAIQAAASACHALPETVEAPWPIDALAPRDTDRLLRRIGKGVGRVVSAARKAGDSRPLPLKAVALGHIHEALTPAVDAAVVDSLRIVAEWEGEIERAWIAWGDLALPALVEGDIPDTLPDDDDEDDGARRENGRNGKNGKTDQEPEEPWVKVRRAAVQLDVSLQALIDEPPHLAASEAARRRLGEARRLLESDLGIAGSFLLTPKQARTGLPELPRLDRSAPAFASWEAGVADRLVMHDSVLAILSGATAVRKRLVHRVRERCLSGADKLTAVADDLEGIAARLPALRRGPDASAQVDRIAAEIASTLEPALGAIPSRDEVEQAVQASSDATADALLAMVRQAPSEISLHPEGSRPPKGSRALEDRDVALQELARQAFDALRIERIRAAALGLVESIETVRSDIAELPDVAAFALDAARSELSNEDADAKEERASSLVQEAVASMAESLRIGRKSVATSLDDAQVRLASEISSGAVALLDRLAAGRMQARLLAARSRLSDLRAWINEEWGPTVDRGAKVLLVRGTRLRRLVERYVKRGSEIVTGPSAGGEASTRSIRRLAEAREVLSSLPLVYQKLFTLDPLDDVSLLAERSGELANAMTRWKRWKEEDGVPLVVRGRPGSGITSFLNVLGSMVHEEGGTTAKIVLDQRVRDEETLARRMAEALELDTDVCSIDGVASAIFAAERGAVPDAVAIDDLEHLYLRVPRGTDLVERLLTLMSETEPRIFWIGGITSSAWQLIAAAEPTAVSQIDLLDLDPFSADELRTVLTVRHRRSGLPVRFEKIPTRQHRLRRWLRKLRDPAAYDELIAADYFDRLHRTSSGNLRLALFQWLTAADFDRGDGVFMHAPSRTDFSVLEALGLNQNFTLKAFLEHRTLTLEEHDRIFRLPRHESFQIFESLRNRHLIAPIGTETDDTPARSEIEENLRYEVRPLLAGAVVSHLQDRNIVH